MKRIIINGANGYVASNFINELLRQDYEVIALVRGSHKYSADDRMKVALAEINDGVYKKTEKLKIFNYSLLHDNFSMSEKQLEEIFSQDADYFHFAASLKFDFKSKEEIFNTNINGIENSLKVFSKYATARSRFFFISTAYSCGKAPGLFQETFYENEEISGFRNYYEQSKRFAENVVRKFIDSHQLNGYIIRLSQVVGHNKTGVTKTDYGIFDFARRVHSLALRYPHKTIRVRVDPDSTQNLIPIDTVVNYLFRTLEVRNLPVIMNFTARNSIKNAHIISSLSNLLPVRLIADKTLSRAEMNALERVISIGMSFTSSYTDVNILFDTKNLDLLVSSNGNEPSEQSVYKMLEYFILQLSDKKKSKVFTSAS
ncbi:SDR family oxidoreductase [Gaoshiqia sp. Z1-71]|uniref:SDR family oxidoreductase n=1 Tax=Gaoshiqia hydrogeniformans TaxID=3290090 RepID=UPI003BF7CFB3